jgi:hypothetical protein
MFDISRKTTEGFITLLQLCQLVQNFRDYLGTKQVMQRIRHSDSETGQSGVVVEPIIQLNNHAFNAPED